MLSVFVTVNTHTHIIHMYIQMLLEGQSKNAPYIKNFHFLNVLVGSVYSM